MKFLVAVIAVFMLFGYSAQAAEEITYEQEMYALGAVSGQGLACKSQKYHQFELLARALIVSKAANDEMQKEGMRRYSAGKVNAFIAVEESHFADCDVIRAGFDGQKIFKSVLYSDGRIKLYDGTLITPRKPYKASALYEKDREAFIKADAAYKKSVALAKKNAQNAQRIQLKDFNYEKMAGQF